METGYKIISSNIGRRIYKKFIVSENKICHEQREDSEKTLCGKIIKKSILHGDTVTVRQRFKNCESCHKTKH